MSDHPLLDIQRLDTEAEQLRHRLATFPTRAEHADALAERDAITAEIESIGLTRVEVTTRQKRLEDEAQIFSDKADEDDTRLYSGEVGIKDLEPLQAEIAGLRDRQAMLEDQAIEAMEEAEALTARLADAEERQQATAARIATLEAEIAATEAEIEGELAVVAEQRAAAVGAVDPAHLAQYERLRPGLGSSTVVAFDGRNCVGCPSAMPAVETDRMKHSPEGSVLDCSECGRIVIT